MRAASMTGMRPTRARGVPPALFVLSSSRKTPPGRLGVPDTRAKEATRGKRRPLWGKRLDVPACMGPQTCELFSADDEVEVFGTQAAVCGPKPALNVHAKVPEPAVGAPEVALAVAHPPDTDPSPAKRPPVRADHDDLAVDLTGKLLGGTNQLGQDGPRGDRSGNHRSRFKAPPGPVQGPQGVRTPGTPPEAL